jgi:hypothetical protein
MLSTEMLFICRSLFDESVAAFFTDAEIYSYLSAGQEDIIKQLVLAWDKISVLPTPLRPLLKQLTGTANADPPSITVPEDYIDYADFHYNNRAYRIVSPNDTFIFHNNAYLTEWVEFYAGTIRVNTNFLAKTYELNYISKPADISTSVNPVLDIRFHNDIVGYAFKQMLIKNQSGENVTQ